METLKETSPAVVASSNILGLDVAGCSKVPESLLHPKTLSDIRDKTFQAALIKFVKRNPDQDFVYKFDLPSPSEEDSYQYLMKGHKCLDSLPRDTGKGIFVGGSSALHYVTGYVNGDNTVNWKANDTDLFFLGCPENSRMSTSPGGLDFIFCKEKTIEEVLLNFDLPCCRVGFDFKYTYYVSAQALVSIFTGKMFLPEYFAISITFLEKLSSFHCDKSKEFHQAVTRMIIKRFYERVKKYQSRGFKVVYTHLDYILPWVENRFTYIDFTGDNVWDLE